MSETKLKLEDQSDNLAALVRRLVHRLGKHEPGIKMIEQANDYLRRIGRQGSILRENPPTASEPDQSFTVTSTAVDTQKVVQCGCYSCLDKIPSRAGKPGSAARDFMVVCPICGNKRCPRATHHDNECTGSNASGQPGSRFAEPVAASDGEDIPTKMGKVMAAAALQEMRNPTEPDEGERPRWAQGKTKEELATLDGNGAWQIGPSIAPAPATAGVRCFHDDVSGIWVMFGETTGIFIHTEDQELDISRRTITELTTVLALPVEITPYEAIALLPADWAEGLEKILEKMLGVQS